MRNEHSTIRARAVFDLVTPGSDPMPVDVALAYTKEDPYAVQASFVTGDAHNPVEWVFGRDLLADGLFNEAGDGDVKVRPHRARANRVELELTSPSGYALFVTNATRLAEFLDQTFELVPPGTEYAWLDLDSALTRMLSKDARGASG
jgi:Streptomyces sporulation and cell division protein, SsgA